MSVVNRHERMRHANPCRHTHAGLHTREVVGSHLLEHDRSDRDRRWELCLHPSACLALGHDTRHGVVIDEEVLNNRVAGLGVEHRQSPILHDLARRARDGASDVAVGTVGQGHRVLAVEVAFHVQEPGVNVDVMTVYLGGGGSEEHTLRLDGLAIVEPQAHVLAVRSPLV